ncbi:hypothetical protein LIER_35692 [Lithospermum erythrorhizon]|uniref:Protein BIG GRAIN 1-like A n=1 Tax=Lithospermum erythrorhizon TaxID=34254 RepID=A0AAV3NVL5_LITER
MNKYSCNVSSNPSFSSTLLEAIYRSIDEGEETMRKKQQSKTGFKDEDEMANFHRLQMIEKWMEKESEKVVVRRKSLADFVPKARNSDNPEVFYSNSSFSSSDSSSGGGFSSSEAEDSGFSVSRNRSASSSCYGLQKPKPIKIKLSDPKRSCTSLSRPHIRAQQFVSELNHDYSEFRHNEQTKLVSVHQQKAGGFEKTKSKALKIYGDFRKARQPISPGGKLASFLNSMFSTVHEKKAKFAAERDRKTKSANASTCSSASSFSKSCLSKTPSSRGDKLLSNGAKRSVRFYPISVILDENCQPCGHKNLHEEKPNFEGYKNAKQAINEELKIYNFEMNFQVEKGANDLLRNYQKRVELEYDLRSSNHNKNQVLIDEDEEDFDAVSCVSSDLFELDNISATGMERYREELPVYETTHFDNNQAIANGMIL